MDFKHDDEQEMTRAVVRAWAEEEAAPGAAERDDAGRFDRALLERLGELGLAGIPWPEESGGAGGGFVTYAVVLEELARVCASTASALAAHTRCSYPVFRLGSAAHAAEMQALAGGRRLGACLFPSAAGLRIGTDGTEITLEGESRLQELGGGCADLYVVCLEPRSGNGRKTKGAVLMLQADEPGIHAEAVPPMLGLRGLPYGTVRFAACRVRPAAVLGDGAGVSDVIRTAEAVGWLGDAAVAAGLARRATETAADYARRRTQFGKLIGQHQAVQFKLADMAAAADAAQLLTLQAAWRADAGVSFRREAALACSYAVRAAERVAVEAVQVLGGYGYMREYGVERGMRDAKQLAAMAGGGEWGSGLIGASLAPLEEG